MSLEQKIEALTAAIEANTAALKAGGGAAASTSKATATKTTKEEKPKAPAHTREEMAALVRKVKAEKGEDAAKGIIKEVGGVEKLADIPDAKIDAVFDAATEKLAEEEDM